MNDVVVQLSVDTLPFGGVGDSKYLILVVVTLCRTKRFMLDEKTQ